MYIHYLSSLKYWIHLLQVIYQIVSTDFLTFTTSAPDLNNALFYVFLHTTPHFTLHLSQFLLLKLGIPIRDCRTKLKKWAPLILQPFRHFTYITAHSQTLLSLYLSHWSFSNPSVASPKSQLILQPFFRFSYVTVSSLNSRGEPSMLNSETKLELKSLGPARPHLKNCTCSKRVQ